jgi:putative ABC transport system permease protein
MPFLDSVTGDLRHAWRAILRMPVVSAVVIVSLAAGIGVNAVVFTWIQWQVLHPLPGVVESAAFNQIEPRTRQGLYPGSSWLEYRDLAEQQQSLRDLIAFRSAPLYVGETGGVERVYGMLVSANYFAALGVRPAMGRFFERSEVTRPGGEPVAVISHGLWRRRLAADPAAVGRTVRINGQPLTIVGVAPDAFQGTVSGINFDVWLPATLAPVIAIGSRELEDRGIRGYALMGRLRSSVTLPQAQRDLDAIMRRLAQTWPAANATVAAEILPFWQAPRGPQRLLMNALAILQSVMLLLLLAICGNTANLVLARASTRQREIGVRLTLGAGPWRIVRLLLVESVVLALVGAALGSAIAVWGTKALQLLPLTGFPLRFQTRVDGVTLVFTAILGIACGVLVGAAAAVHLARVDPQQALRAGAKTATRSPLRHTLMAVQVALALVVLIVGGLFVQSFLDTRHTDPGFRRDGVLLASYDFSGRERDARRARTFADSLLDRLRARPAIEAAAITSAVPLDIHGLPSRAFTIDGRASSDETPDTASTNTVTPGYFALMGIPLRKGADFVDLADTSTAPQAIVNEAFVARYLAGLEPLGQRLRTRGRAYDIVGVVATSVSNAFGEAPTPVIYLAWRDSPASVGEIHLRTRAGAEATLVPEVRRTVAALDPELPVFNVRTLNEHVDTNLIFRRLPARMFVVLGPLLLALASIGIYAVVAYTVSLRTMEIGLRLAIGATASRLVAQLVAESLRVIIAGAAVGWFLAFALATKVAGVPIDLAVFIGVPALLLSVAAVACWWPAHRAASIDPSAALRQD